LARLGGRRQRAKAFIARIGPKKQRRDRLISL